MRNQDIHNEIVKDLGYYASMRTIAKHYGIKENNYNMAHLNNLVESIASSRK